MDKVIIVWFNKDLRLKDHLALNAAVQSGYLILPLYIYDPSIKQLGGAQKWWLHHSLNALNQGLTKLGSRLILRKGKACDVFKALSAEVDIAGIYWHTTYTSDLIHQTDTIIEFCKENQIEAKRYQGNLLLEPHQIQTLKGGSFSVYTPFWNALQKCPIAKPLAKPKFLSGCPDVQSDKLEEWHLKEFWSEKFEGLWQPGEATALEMLHDFIDGPVEAYNIMRDFPGKEGTSQLSPYLHFGEISCRDIWHQVLVKREFASNGSTEGYTTFLKEIVWREFCAHLLFHNPIITKDNFRKEFDEFPWAHNQDFLTAWQQGKTGYPIIDAGMRQLWATGVMHNRVRMIVASFLTKNLLIDWRHGEAWFWDTLLDADQASNAANWQWVAGCGADAAPYFRIFNPVLQSEKFDRAGEYIRTWVPELKLMPDKYIHAPYEADPYILSKAGVTTYPRPIVDLKATRDRALSLYKTWVAGN